jgi:hypothetical protein
VRPSCTAAQRRPRSPAAHPTRPDRDGPPIRRVR